MFWEEPVAINLLVQNPFQLQETSVRSSSRHDLCPPLIKQFKKN